MYCIDINDVRQILDEADRNRPQGSDKATSNYVRNRLDAYEEQMRKEERDAVLPEWDVVEELDAWEKKWEHLYEDEPYLTVGDMISVEDAIALEAQWWDDYDGDYPTVYPH